MSKPPTCLDCHFIARAHSQPIFMVTPQPLTTISKPTPIEVSYSLVNSEEREHPEELLHANVAGRFSCYRGIWKQRAQDNDT